MLPNPLVAAPNAGAAGGDADFSTVTIYSSGVAAVALDDTPLDTAQRPLLPVLEVSK